jgi:hypothetical protein
MIRMLLLQLAVEPLLLHATGDNANETGIAIGFSFDYAGTIYTTIGLSTNGVAWFDAVAPATTVGNVNMVTTSGPNKVLRPGLITLLTMRHRIFCTRQRAHPAAGLYYSIHKLSNLHRHNRQQCEDELPGDTL